MLFLSPGKSHLVLSKRTLTLFTGRSCFYLILQQLILFQIHLFISDLCIYFRFIYLFQIYLFISDLFIYLFILYIFTGRPARYIFVN